MSPPKRAEDGVRPLERTAGWNAGCTSSNGNNGRLLTVHVSFSLSLFYARCRESRERRPLFSKGWMVRRHSFFVNDGAPSTPADKEDTSVVLAVHVAISKQGR